MPELQQVDVNDRDGILGHWIWPPGIVDSPVVTSTGELMGLS